MKKLIGMIAGLLPNSILSRLVELRPGLIRFVKKERMLTVNFKNDFFGKVKMQLNSGYYIDRKIIVEKRYDLKTLLYLKRLVHEGDTCIDIGANIGSITLPLLHAAGEKGFVYAFEPGPSLFKQLEKNVKLNHYPNVKILNLGISDEKGFLYLRFDKSVPGNAFLSDTGDFKVAVERLDDIPELQQLPKIDFIKIDVEGMELNVLQGGYKLVEKHLPTILYETQVKDNPDKVKLIEELLTKMGYHFFEIDIPEKKLSQAKTGFNFIPCNFPLLPQNTLAVHHSKLSILENN